jgi:hypothetical protein
MRKIPGLGESLVKAGRCIPGCFLRCRQSLLQSGYRLRHLDHGALDSAFRGFQALNATVENEAARGHGQTGDDAQEIDHHVDAPFCRS